MLACAPNAPDRSDQDMTVQSALGTVACANNTTCNPLVQGPGTTGSGLCCQEAFQSCDGGRWPDGKVYYQFSATNSSAQNQMFRLVMDDWQDATNGAIQFVQGSPPPAQGGNPMTVHYGGSNGTDFNTCSGGACAVNATESNAYHEIGHSLLNFHYWQRNDRNHYMVIRDINGQCDGNTRCPSDNQRDFGPFDFKSTMLYSASYPAHTRYDGSRLCSPSVPNSCDSSGCTGSAANRYNKCATPAIACPPGSAPGCIACSGNNQPYGPPTDYDGAAIVELYRNLAEPGWKKFRRTVNEVTTGSGATLPFDYKLAPGVTLSGVDPTPAIATWGGTDLAIFVLGTDKHIYAKWKLANNPVSWSTWNDLDCCFNSAPSAVSWASGRTDVVARGEDNAIYIKSETPGAWTSWQYLGGSAGSGPAITSWGPNRLDVFVKSSSNGDLLVKSCTANCLGASGTWTSGWQANFPNGGLVGKPAVVSRGSGLIDIYVHGGDHRLYANQYYNGVAGSWSLVANGPLQWDAARPDLFSPAAAARSSSYIEVFARGVGVGDDKLSVITWTGTWSPWKVLGGVLASAPGTVSRVRDSARSDVAGVMAEETTFSNPPTYAHGIWWKEYNP
jgi:hypothetical protein